MSGQEQVEQGLIGTVIDEPGDGPMYTPAPGELQLTVRALVTGCLIGAVVSAMNIRFGLKVGWSFGGSLIAAILGYAFFSSFGHRDRPFTPLETNISQTAGSAAGSMASAAGLLSAIPAMQLLGFELGLVELLVWATSVAWLGVFFAVPLRRQMVLVDKLRFPTGTATAATITAMFSSGAEAVRKARVLILFAGLAAAHVGLAHFFPQVGHPEVHTWLGEGTAVGGMLAVGAAYGFSLLISPIMTGAGLLIGIRTTSSLLLGAVVGWAILAPFVESQGWVAEPESHMSYSAGARGWILWPGVALMVADALTSLALAGRTIVNTFTGSGGDDGDAPLEDPEEAIPNAWWIGGLGFATVLTVGSAWALFGIPPYLSVLGVALSSILAAIAVRSTGETDINPTGGMGKVTQLVYGVIAPGSIPTNLMTAAVTSAGASQAADMMQDLKTGHLLGASPRRQLVAQLVGAAAGIFTAVPVYVLVTRNYEVGGEEYPAPAAFAWKAMAELLAEGVGALPTGAIPAVGVAVLVGIALPVLRKLTGWTFLPSALAMGIAMIVPAYYAIAMFLGAVALQAWKAVDADQADQLVFAVASGLLVGDGVMGIVIMLGTEVLAQLGL